MAWILADEADNAILKEIERGPDRTAAIVAASYLEDRLAETLCAAFEGDKEVTDRMMKGYGPLATFAAKIDLAHMLGMIRPEMRKELFIVKDIRNEFAHKAIKTTFRSQRIRDLSRQLGPAIWRKKFFLSSQEAAGLVAMVRQPPPGIDPKYDENWVSAVLNRAIRSGRDTPRNRYMMAVKEALLHFSLIKLAIGQGRRLCEANALLGRTDMFWPWPSFGKSLSPTPQAQKSGRRKRSRPQRQRKSSQA